MVKINWTPNEKQLKQFGLTILIGMGLIGAFLLWRGFPRTGIGLAAFGAVTAAVSLIAPAAAKPVYMVWMGVAFVMGKIVGTIMLGLVYFGMITPLALGMRLWGRDELRIKKQAGDSFWRAHPRITDKNYWERLF